MSNRPFPPYIAAHVASVKTRSAIHTTALTAVLVRQCWPAGIADRSEPAALQSVRLAGPGIVGPLPSACTCARGHCLVCN